MPFMDLERIKALKESFLKLGLLTDEELLKKWQKESFLINTYYKQICGFIIQETKLKQEYIDGNSCLNPNKDKPECYETFYKSTGKINRDSQYFKNAYNIAFADEKFEPLIVLDFS